MIPFLLRRLLWFGITLFVVASVSFFLMHKVKGGPFDNERALDPAIEANIKARYHLDWPLYKQFAQYMGPFNLDERGLFGSGPEKGTVQFTGVLTGDFGPSFRYRDFTVNDIIAQSLPISALLGVVAM
ncbi:MAG TPA: hypothetical protein P5218_07705, partial [Planctomycetota bacterium]|nr:hypothetical protein [Planctomycetota bacterium]